MILPNALQDDARMTRIAQDLFRLTRREALVAARLASGQGPQGTANALGVSVDTVRSHIRRIFEKCEVRTLSELVALLHRL